MTEQTYPNITMSCIVSPDSKVETILKDAPDVNDLEFSEYQGLINKFWNQLDFSCRLDDLNEVLPKVNKIRNRVMHFRPEGVSDEDRIELEWLRKLL